MGDIDADNDTGMQALEASKEVNPCGQVEHEALGLMAYVPALHGTQYPVPGLAGSLAM